MIRHSTAWMVLVFFVGLAGCAMFQPAGTPIYHDDFLTISLEPNLEKAGPVEDGQAQQTITAQQLADVLRGLEARKVTGIIQSSVGLSDFEPVFSPNELWLVSEELRKGLRQASPQERVAFQLWRPRGKGREETRGAIYLRGSMLYVTLSKFRASNRMDYEGAEGGSGKAVELLFEPSDAVVPRQQGFATRWLGSDQPAIVIDTQRLRNVTEPALPSAAVEPTVPTPADVRPASSQAQAAPPSPDSDTVRKLQQQVKELTEELTRLRQELAELKQLLADKVLELNRLKSRSN
jgi:hypothetical protein